MTTRLRTLLGDHPGTAALKSGAVKSDSVAFDFVDYTPAHKGFKPMVNSLYIWYRPHRDAPIEKVASQFADFLLQGLRCPPDHDHEVRKRRKRG